MKHALICKVGIALAVGVASIASASAETLKVSTFLPPKHAFNRMLTQWGEELAEKSGGELTMELFPAGQLGPAPRQYDLASSGAADISVVLHAATPGRFPMTGLAAMPLSYPSEGSASTISSKRLTELAPEYLAAEHPGTKILWMAVTPPLKVNLADKKPETLDDLKGLRIRYAGKVFQQMIESLGASPMPVPPGEVSEAMAKGVIDGATFPFEAVMAFDLGQVVKYSLEPGMASATFAVVMNENSFNALPEKFQKLIMETTGPARAAAFGAMWDEGEAKGRQYAVDHGIDIVTLDEGQVKKLTEIVTPMIDASISAVEESGKPGRAFYDAYTK